MEQDNQSSAILVPAWFTRLHVISFAGAVLTVFGSFMPWATATIIGLSINKAGIDGDGKLTMWLGIAAAAVLAIRKWGAAISAVLQGMALCVAVADILDTSRRAGDVNGMSRSVHVSVGYGLWIVAVASLAGAIAAITLAREQRSA